MAVLRSLLAVVAGMAFIIAASTGMDQLLARTLAPSLNSPQAGAPVLALALAYRAIFGVAGGWIAARLAPSRPLTHAVVLGAIGTLAAAAGAVAMWSVGQHWYPIALAVLALPECWLGGRLAGAPVARPGSS